MRPRPRPVAPRSEERRWAAPVRSHLRPPSEPPGPGWSERYICTGVPRGQLRDRRLGELHPRYYTRDGATASMLPGERVAYVQISPSGEVREIEVSDAIDG